ncbi:MAG: hypothetical protein Tp1122DCM00d2C27307611_47 [Prokaryotic dsDNA virus sp.]|nr:MAG: hypothetical protein Tp1122DCM00d2C27307611_47 [Prokaryotic dsDNA virus sp.]|tara:strand:- start:18577 stop:18762 length:186 start_codon:yes stop_codon:yes gene_type:complete
MKIKAKASYKKLDNTENYLSLSSASKHIKLMEGLEIEIKGDIPEGLKDHLIEIKNTKGGKK